VHQVTVLQHENRNSKHTSMIHHRSVQIFSSDMDLYNSASAKSVCYIALDFQTIKLLVNYVPGVQTQFSRRVLNFPRISFPRNDNTLQLTIKNKCYYVTSLWAVFTSYRLP
jgi:hypothetical protein